MEIYDKWFKNNGYKFLNSGLIHNVYEKDNYIFKIVKSNITSSNTNDHFEKELRCLKYLYNRGYSVVNIEKIFKKGELINNYCVLQERKIEGTCYNEHNIPPQCIYSILKFIKDVECISLNEYGIVFDKHFSSDITWENYINKQIIIANNVIKKYFPNNSVMLRKIKIIDKKYLTSINSKFLIMDPNPENFIFNDEKMIAIDIDHPIGGDPLWQSACFYWYKDAWKEKMISLNYFNESNYEMMLIYCLIFGLTVFDFLENSFIEIDRWYFDRMRKLMEELVNE